MVLVAAFWIFAALALISAFYTAYNGIRRRPFAANLGTMIMAAVFAFLTYIAGWI
jgi:hypothetical protein